MSVQIPCINLMCNSYVSQPDENMLVMRNLCHWVNQNCCIGLWSKKKTLTQCCIYQLRKLVCTMMGTIFGTAHLTIHLNWKCACMCSFDSWIFGWPKTPTACYWHEKYKRTNVEIWYLLLPSQWSLCRPFVNTAVTVVRTTAFGLPRSFFD